MGLPIAAACCLESAAADAPRLRFDDATILAASSAAAEGGAPRQRCFYDTTWWDPYVENISDTDTYLRRKFRQDVTDKTTGLSQEALNEVLAGVVAGCRASGESWRITKAKLFAAQVERQSIDVSPFDWFPAIAVWDRWSRPIRKVGGRVVAHHEGEVLRRADRAPVDRRVAARLVPGDRGLG